MNVLWNEQIPLMSVALTITHYGSCTCIAELTLRKHFLYLIDSLSTFSLGFIYGKSSNISDIFFRAIEIIYFLRSFWVESEHKKSE